MPDHSSFQQEIERALRLKFERRNQQQQDQLKSLARDKEAYQRQNKQYQDQIAAYNQEVKEALKIHKANQQLQAKVENADREHQRLLAEKQVLEDANGSLNEKVAQQAKHINFLESENEKIQHIRKLE